MDDPIELSLLFFMILGTMGVLSLVFALAIDRFIYAVEKSYSEVRRRHYGHKAP